MSVSASKFSNRLVEIAQRTPPVPYILGGRTLAGTDCSNLPRLVIRELGGTDIVAGSNKMWDQYVSNKFFIHDGGAFKGGGFLIPGAVLFISYADTPTQNAKGDLGKMDHMGIYVGNVSGLKTPDGKQGNVVHASQSRGMVCASTLQNAWTHGGWLRGINYVDISVDMPDNSINGNGSSSVGGDASTKLPPRTEPLPGEAMIRGDGVRMRRQPRIVDGVNHNRICTVPNGTIMSILARKNGWTQLAYLIHTGWVRDDLLQFG